jgi:hypothetical protein
MGYQHPSMTNWSGMELPSGNSSGTSTSPAFTTKEARIPCQRFPDSSNAGSAEKREKEISGRAFAGEIVTGTPQMDCALSKTDAHISVAGGKMGSPPFG